MISSWWDFPLTKFKVVVYASLVAKRGSWLRQFSRACPPPWLDEVILWWHRELYHHVYPIKKSSSPEMCQQVGLSSWNPMESQWVNGRVTTLSPEKSYSNNAQISMVCSVFSRRMLTPNFWNRVVSAEPYADSLHWARCRAELASDLVTK